MGVFSGLTSPAIAAIVRTGAGQPLRFSDLRKKSRPFAAASNDADDLHRPNVGAKSNE
jgi:hypothetical protein